MFFSLLLIAAQAADAPVVTREPDGTAVIAVEIAADAPDPVPLDDDQDAALDDVERERETRRAFEEAIDAARSATPF